MGKVINRNLGPIEHLQPGEYTVETRDEEPVLRCPECGGYADVEFAVHIGGVVSQIFSCPYVSCPFQAYLTLAEWNEPVVRRPA